MADSKKIAEVTVVVGAKADTKSVVVAAKELAAEAATQKLKVPVSLVPQGLDKILSSLPSGPKSSNSDFKKLKGDVNDFLKTQKKQKQAQEDFFDALESRALAAEKASIQEATNATNFAAAKKQADDKFLDALFERTDGAEKLSIQEATQATKFLKNKKQADDRFINALFKRTEGAEKIAILEATQATEAESSAIKKQNQKNAADDKFLNAIFKRTDGAEKIAIREATEATNFQAAKDKSDDKFLDAVFNRAAVLEKIGIQEATEATKAAAQSAAARKRKEDEDNKFINALFNRTKGMEKLAIQEATQATLADKTSARDAGKSLEKSIKDQEKKNAQKIIDAQKELITNQQDRINEVRKAIALQRIQNKSLEKQGKLANPVATQQSSNISTSSLSDGIKRAAEGTLILARNIAKAVTDTTSFTKDVTRSALEQRRLKEILADQNSKLNRANGLYPVINNLLLDIGKELEKERTTIRSAANSFTEANKEVSSNKGAIRAINAELSKSAVISANFSKNLNDKFGISSLDQAGDLSEFFFDKGSRNEFIALSKLISKERANQEKFNSLTEQKTALENRNKTLLEKSNKALNVQSSAISRVKELDNKKARLLEENQGLLGKINSITSERIRTLSQLAAAEARGLVNRAANFLTGGGSRGNGGAGGPPKNPGGPSNSGGGSGGNRGDDSFKKGVAGVNAFNTGLARSLTFLEKLRLNLNEADKAALQFGQTSKVATDRLLAFAAPSTLIYKTVSAIRTASQELINLDTQARRLVFFEEAGRSGGLGKFNKDINDSIKRSQLLGNAFKNIAEEANRTGLSMETVTEAAQTVSRIGEISFLPGGISSDFLKATLGLTQIEAGALNSERAAEILKATLAQFGLEADSVTSVAAKFATVANETSVNVEQLATLVTRFGSAAINVQNLNFDQTLALASISAKTLGTNTFRTATALRQLTTKLVDNIDKVKELSGVDVTVGESGQLRGIESLLDVLEKVNQLGQTSTGVELAKLIGDRENLSDIFALAKVVPELRGSIQKLSNTQTVAAQSSQQIAAFLSVIGLQSDSVESSINRLNTAFKSFLNSAGTTSIIDGFVKGLTSFVKLSTDVTDAIGGIGGAITALGPIASVIFGDIAKKGLLSLIGFINGPDSKTQIKKSFESLLNTPVKRTETIELLSKQGLLDIQVGNKYLQVQNNLEREKLAIEKQIQGIKVLINAEEKKTVQDLDRVLNLERARLGLERQLENSIKRQQASTKDLLNENLTGFALLKKNFRENAGGIISSGLATAGTIFSQIIPSFISSPESAQKVESSVIKVFSSASIGAQVGSIFGPKGAVGGAIVGGLIASVQQAADKIAEILAKNFAFRGGPDETGEELDAQARQQLRAIKIIRENIALREEAEKKSAQEVASLEAQARGEERLNKLREVGINIAQIEKEIAFNRSKGLNVQDLLTRKQILAAERHTLELQTSKDIVNEERRRLQILEKIASLEIQQETRSTINDIEKQTSIQLNKLNRGGNLKELQIGIEFDRRQIQDKINGLVKQRDIRIDAIAELTPDKKEDKEKFQKEVLELEKKIINERIQANKLIRDEQFAVLEKQEEVAREVIDSYRQAGEALIDAQEKIFSQNKSIVSLLNNQRDLADKRAENRNSRIRNQNPANDITNAIQALRNRQNAVTPELQANKRATTGLEDDFKKVGTRLKELQAIAQLNKEKITNEIAARQALLEAEQNNFDQRVGFERDNLEALKGVAEQLVSKQQELIAAEVKMIEVIKDRAKREAEFGRNLLDSPEEAFKNLKNLDLAQQFLNIDKELNSRGTRQRFDADKSGQLSLQERETARNSIIADRLEKLIGQTGGRGIAQQILEGLKFAGGLPNDPFNSSSFGGAAQAEELLARLIGGGSVPKKPGETSQEDRQLATIENRRKELDDTFKAMNDIVNQQIELERKVKEVETERLSLIQKQVSQLKEIDLNNALNSAAAAAIRFKETVDGSKPAFDKINEIATRSVTNENVERLIKDLGAASENLNRIATDNGLQGEQIASSLGETFNEAIVNLSDTLNNLRVEVLNEIPPLTVQLEGNIKQTLNGEELAAVLKRELIGTGLEDRVSEIQGIITRLVEIEKARGGKFPPTPPR